MNKQQDEKLELAPLMPVLNDGQKIAHDRVVAYVTRQGSNLPKIVLIKGFAGTGKAQPVGTPILTPYGWRKMGDLKVGDEITGADGKRTKVTGIFPQGKKAVAKVLMSDGTHTTACYEHLWFTSSYEERNRDRARKNKSKTRGYRYNPIKGSIKTTKDIANSLYNRDGEVLNHKIPIVAPVEFVENFNIPSLDPYMLGCIIGDGSITTNSLSITTPDKEIFGHMVLPDSIVIVPVKVSTGKCPCYGIRSRISRYNYVVDTLRKLGLLGCKSECKFIPEVYLFNSIEGRIRLLQGLMDTDGTVDKRGYHISYGTSSERLAKDVQFLVQSLGGVAIINQKPTDYLLSYNVTITLPAHILPFKLSRKAKVAIPKTRYIPTRYITNVVDAGIEECVCISISNDDQLYVTDHCIITHNTFTTNRIVASLQEYCSKHKQRLDIAASAPTHKAVRCLRKAAGLGNKVEYATIHSLLGLRPEPEEKSGKQEFKKSTNPEDGRISEFNVLILDEISQLGELLWSELMKAMEEHDFRLILLGDEVQIPPVKEKDSLPFLKADLYGIETIVLDQSMRQAGDNPILDYATEIRNTYKSNIWVDYKKFAKTNEKGEGIEVLQGTDSKGVATLLEDLFGSDYFRADADYAKVVTWTNEKRTAGIFNKQIRRLLYSVPEGMLGLPMIVNGEKLIMNDRYVAAGEFKPIVLPNNEELEVERYEIVKKAVTYKLWTPMGYVDRHLNPQIYKALVRFRGINNNWIKATLNITHETSIAEVNDMMEKISNSAKSTPLGYERKNMWKHFWEIHGIFAQIGYNYALTSHKAQGSTYQNCVMIAYDIKQNPKYEERNRIAYVAGTRAKKKLYIIE